MLSKIKQEEAKEKIIQGAWIGFQLGAGGDKRFGEYLESLGLSETEPLPQITAKEALDKARKIREKAKKIKEKK